jgi:xanthine dehydrogenase accessory factor
MTGPATAGPSAWLDHRPVGWLDAAIELLAVEPAVVRVTVASLRGSAPREAGASLVVSRGTLRGTIGGGALEHQSITAARALLDDPAAAPVRTIDFRLGPDLAQCCGGRVVVWIERLVATDRAWLDAARRSRDATGRLVMETRCTDGREVVRSVVESRGTTDGGRASPDADNGTGSDASDGRDAGTAGTLLFEDGATLRLLERWRDVAPPLLVFGAGHVGQAVLRLLAELPLYRVTWIDPRPELLPAMLPAHVHARCVADPVDAVATLPAGAQVLVFTHDHELDYALCRAILLRGDARWIGLIGSASKNARFRSRLRRDGLSAAQVARLTCPIGNPAIRSKLPTAIAIGVIAQLLELAGEFAHDSVATRDRGATTAAPPPPVPPRTAPVAATAQVTCDPDCGRCSLSTAAPAGATS